MKARKPGPLYHSVLSVVTYKIKYGIDAEFWLSFRRPWFSVAIAYLFQNVSIETHEV
jgi:hypothetical protein